MIPKALTILIIDDSPEDRETYKEYLERYTDHIFTFLEEEDSERGLATCGQVELDCILLDYNLPGVNGLSFLTQLKLLKQCSEVPIVMITGRGSEKIAVEALKQGASDYLVKSEITPENLFRAVKNAVDKMMAQKELNKQIAQRIRAENELKKSEERLRMLIEAVQDYALIMVDTSGKIMSWNAGASRILGYHASEVIGHKVLKIFIQEDVRNQAPEEELALALKTGKSESDRWYVKRGGEQFWASSIVRPMYDIEGVCLGFVKILRDQTERREQENKLKDAVVALNQALDTRDEFLTLASHELKTPLTALKLKLQMNERLLRKNSTQLNPSKLVDFFTKADLYLTRLSKTIEDILYVTKINENSLEIHPLENDLSELMENVAGHFIPFLEASGCSVSIDIEPGVKAEVDPAKLEQALMNLISNSTYFTPGKPVGISLATEAGKAIIRIRDEGMQIPKEKLGTIFQKFSGIDYAKNGGGLGLGLFMSRYLIEAHKGEIALECDEKTGCLFTISLPLRATNVERSH